MKNLFRAIKGLFSSSTESDDLTKYQESSEGAAKDHLKDSSDDQIKQRKKQPVDDIGSQHLKEPSNEHPKRDYKQKQLQLKQEVSFDSELQRLISNVDINSPPGIAGDLCNDIARMERRRLPSLRPAAALAILSVLSRNRLNFDGEKMTFFAMITALSGGGKEAHQRYIKAILTALHLLKMLCGKPRSDRNIMLDLLEQQEVAYVIDEGHELFEKALSSKAKSFESGMGDLLLELKTTSLYSFSGNLSRELSTPIIQKLESLRDKTLLSDEDSRQINMLEAKLEYLQDGMPNPYLSLVSYSTPIKSDFIVNLETIMSGFIGRFYYFRGPASRGPLLKKLESDAPCESIIERCSRINGINSQIEKSPDCEELLDQITEYFEQDELLNHEQLGAIYARGSEHVKHMASLLAAETGEVSSEMLIYSTRVFIDNVNSYLEVLNKKLVNDDAQLMESAERIALDVSVKSGPVTKGVLANQIDKRNATVRKNRKEKDSKFHYQLINKLIKTEVLIEIGGKYVHHNVYKKCN